MTASADQNWKKIGPLPGSMYAEMVGEVLEQKKIPYYLSQSWFSAAYGARGANALGDQAFIFVPEFYSPEAQSIIDSMFPEADE